MKGRASFRITRRGGEEKAAWMCGGEGESGYLLLRIPRELKIQEDKPQHSAGMRRAVRWCEAPGADGICAGSRFSAVYPFPEIPDFPEFPSLPHRLPTPLTLRQVSGSLQRSVPAKTFRIKDSVNATVTFEHKSFFRLPLSRPAFQFCISVLSRRSLTQKNTFQESLSCNNCPEVSYMFPRKCTWTANFPLDHFADAI